MNLKSFSSAELRGRIAELAVELMTRVDDDRLRFRINETGMPAASISVWIEPHPRGRGFLATLGNNRCASESLFAIPVTAKTLASLRGNPVV